MKVERSGPPARPHHWGGPHTETVELLEATAATPGEWFAARGVTERVARSAMQTLQRKGREAAMRKVSGKWNESGALFDLYARLPEGGAR